MITILRNVPERDLTPRELEKFIEIALTFLRRHTEDSMSVEGLELYHQKLMKVDAASCGAVTTDASSSKQQARASMTVGETTKKSLKNEDSKCQVWGMELTLIVKVSFAFLPNSLLGNLAAVAFEEHEQEFLDLLHEQQAFYTFFKVMDGISAVGIQELTPPPTESPTTYAYFLENQPVVVDENATITEETDTGLGFGLFVGIGIGFLWCCLTAISIAYLMNARGEMEESRDLENLLNAEKADPVAAAAATGDDEKDDVLRKKSDRYDTSSNDSSDPFDQSNNPRGNARAQRVDTAVAARRVHSTDDLKRVQFRSSTGERPMAQSVVVTKNENRVVLEKDKNSKGLLNQSAPDLRKSSTRKKSSSASQKLSQSMNVESLEESLAKNDHKVLRRSGRSSMKGSSEDSRRSSTRSSSKESLRLTLTNDSNENHFKLRGSVKDTSRRPSNWDDGRLRHSDKGGSSQQRSSSKAMRSHSMIT
jgi:hypothetical protein